MHVVTVDVGVFIDHIWLVTEPHLFHILAGDCRQLCIGQNIIGMRIEGDMHHRPLCLCSGWHPLHEVGEGTSDVNRAGAVIVDFVGVE